MSYDDSLNGNPPVPSGVFTITRFDSGKPERNEGKLAYRLRVQVAGEGEADGAVFVYLARPTDTANGDFVAVFDHVASVKDLANIPVGMPASETEPGYFRLDSVDMIFRKWDTLETVWSTIVDHVRRLASTITTLSDLESEGVNVSEGN